MLRLLSRRRRAVFQLDRQWSFALSALASKTVSSWASLHRELRSDVRWPRYALGDQTTCGRDFSAYSAHYPADWEVHCITFIHPQEFLGRSLDWALHGVCDSSCDFSEMFSKSWTVICEVTVGHLSGETRYTTLCFDRCMGWELNFSMRMRVSKLSKIAQHHWRYWLPHLSQVAVGA